MAFVASNNSIISGGAGIVTRIFPCCLQSFKTTVLCFYLDICLFLTALAHLAWLAFSGCSKLKSFLFRYLFFKKNFLGCCIGNVTGFFKIHQYTMLPHSTSLYLIVTMKISVYVYMYVSVYVWRKWFVNMCLLLQSAWSLFCVWWERQGGKTLDNRSLPAC